MRWTALLLIPVSLSLVYNVSIDVLESGVVIHYCCIGKPQPLKVYLDGREFEIPIKCGYENLSDSEVLSLIKSNFTPDLEPGLYKPEELEEKLSFYKKMREAYESGNYCHKYFINRSFKEARSNFVANRIIISYPQNVSISSNFPCMEYYKFNGKVICIQENTPLNLSIREISRREALGISALVALVPALGVIFLVRTRLKIGRAG